LYFLIILNNCQGFCNDVRMSWSSCYYIKLIYPWV
jgi:hypothetical protein